MRKWIFLIFLIVIAIQSGFSQTIKINWLTLDEVKKQFEIKQKPIIIYLYTDNCDSCKLMEDSVFSLDEVANYINVLTYPVRINANAKDSLTFFDGTKYINKNDGKSYHDIIYFLGGEQPVFPSLVCFNRQATGTTFTGFKSRDAIFPILIYHTEDVHLSCTYEQFYENYIKAYPPGQAQIVTRLLIKWKTYNEMMELQKTAPRKIIIDLYYNYSITATMMRTHTYNNPVIAKYLNDNFYCVTIDAGYKDTIDFKGTKFINEGLAHGYHQFVIAALEGKMKFPAFIILDENLNFLDRVQLYMRPEDFEPVMRYYGDNVFKSMSFQDFKKDFKSSLNN